MSQELIDLSQVDAPDVVEELDFEAIRQAMLDDLVARDPDYSALAESDPAVKLLEVAAYREMLLRQRVNDAARAVLLPTAAGADLDNIAARYDVFRTTVDPGDPDAIPPIAPTYESDESLRARTVLAMEALTVAGTEGAYEFHARSADSRVSDVAITSPSAGQVLVTVLSKEGDGVPSQDLMDAVDAVVQDESVRPLCDSVEVAAAELVTYQVAATLHVQAGPDAEAVRQSALAVAQAYIADAHQLGAWVTLSGLFAALHQSGVTRVELDAPTSDIEASAGQAPYCTDLTVSLADG